MPRQRPEAGYPEVRAREAPAPVLDSVRYERHEGTNGEVTLADADAIIHTFSGEPDMIYLVARANAAIVTLTDRLNREDDSFVLVPNQPLKLNVGRERVRARNADAGQAATLSVMGFWVARDEAGTGG